MKIANVLTVSTLLAMFSVVACSSAPPPAGSSESNSTKKDTTDDDDDTSAKDDSEDDAEDDSSSTTTDGDDPFAACDACMGDKSPTYAKALTCAKACGEEDYDCQDECFADCGDPETGECAEAATSCQSTCDAAAEEVQKQCTRVPVDRVIAVGI